MEMERQRVICPLLSQIFWAYIFTEYLIIAYDWFHLEECDKRIVMY